jgi:hypothetical protein
MVITGGSVGSSGAPTIAKHRFMASASVWPICDSPSRLLYCQVAHSSSSPLALVGYRKPSTSNRSSRLSTTSCGQLMTTARSRSSNSRSSSGAM